MTDAEYAALPPLVAPGEDREAVIERVVAGWADSVVSYDEEKQIVKDGFALERVALIDGNTGEPIDLGELVRQVDERLRKRGEPEEYKFPEDRCILLKGCRVDRCDCTGLNIRPRWIASRVKFGGEARFHSATFGNETRFDSTKFSDNVSFRSARFGNDASFDFATFGDWTGFDSVTFGDEAIFDSTTFGDYATFVSATFGNDASFDSATFGDEAIFDSTTFGDGARFGSATFGKRASFNSATFGKWTSFFSTSFGDGASFNSATFGDVTLFLNARFGSNGGIEGAVSVLSPPPRRSLPRWKRWPIHLWRNLCRPYEWFDWVRVQALGRLQILTRVSYLALIIVPILAGRNS